MKRLRMTVGAFFLLATTISGSAQVPTDETTPAPNRQSLAAALATASVPSDRVFLTVSAEKILLPQDAPILSDKSSLTTVTDTYQRSVRAFGSVTAIAPPTMFVLNLHPSDPNLYAGLQSDEAFKLLAASLSDAQWQALTSQGGLGMSDLTDETQRQCFQAIFPQGKVEIGGMAPGTDTPDAHRDLSAELSEIHLRLSDRVRISLPVKDNPHGSTGGNSKPTAAYYWIQGVNHPDPYYGILPRMEVPNQPKQGQLDWNLPVLQTPIPIAGLKTVADLITRIAAATHLELYADQRYENKSLTILGAKDMSIPAADALHALAYCVTGTFRQVGPAYILTDDLMGTEARRAIQSHYQQQLYWSLTEKINKASDVLGTKRSLRELTSFDDPLALNADEAKQVPFDDPIQASSASFTLPLNQLTSAQQDNVHQQADSIAQMAHDSTNNSFVIPVPDLGGKMTLNLEPKLELLVPSLNSPVSAQMPFFDFFKVSFKHEHFETEAASPSQISLAHAIALTPNRAILIQAHSPAELSAVITRMKQLGFNALWLDAFSEGRFQTTQPNGKDLLTQALRLTHGTGIHVYAVIDLFQWGTDTVPSTIDYDVLGRTSAQAKADLYQAASANAEATGNPPPVLDELPGLSVTPFDPQIAGRLVAVTKTLARHPGLAGIVWAKTAPGGYNNELDSNANGSRPDLGYNIAARLAFLRQEHADPVDISKTRIFHQGMGDIGIHNFPEVDIPGFDNETQDAQLSIAWDKLRMDTNLGVIQSLLQAVRSVSPTLPIFVQRRRGEFSNNWYGSWDSPTAPLPDWREVATRQGDFSASTRALNYPDHIAKRQSHIAFAGFDSNDANTLSGLPAALEDNLKDSVWDGFVWDISQLKSSPLTAAK